MKIIVRDETIQLLPQRAAFWVEKETLILADIHLGKAAAFRRLGIPIPEGAMKQDLMRMKELIEKLGTKRCIVVGDLIHAKAGLTEPVVEMFSEWLKEVNCEIDLVIGNHDRSLQKHLPHEWSLQLHKESFIDPPFCFCHFPCQKEDFYVWSGHLHPQIAIRGKIDRVVVRCFSIGKDVAILPAFSSFVGGTLIQKDKDTKLYGIANDKILEI